MYSKMFDFHFLWNTIPVSEYNLSSCEIRLYYEEMVKESFSLITKGEVEKKT